MGGALGPWRWLRGCPEERRHDLIVLWAELLQGITNATPRREDPRLHVSDMLHARHETLTPELSRLFLDGIYKHLKWQEILKHTPAYRAHEVEVQKDGAVGTIDFIVEVDREGLEQLVLDVKTVSQGNFDRVKEGTPLPHHRDQVIQYLDMYPDAPYGVIIYENREDLDIALCVVEPNPERAEAIRERRKARDRGDSRDGQAQGGEQVPDGSGTPPSGP